MWWERKRRGERAKSELSRFSIRKDKLFAYLRTSPSALLTGWIQALATIGILVVTGCYTYYAAKQVDHMKAAVEATNKLIEVTDRPWVKVDLEVDPITFSEKELNIPFRVIMKNVGKSVATQVEVRCQVLVNPNEQTILKEQDEFCNTAGKGPLSDSVFPKDTYKIGFDHHDMQAGKFLARSKHTGILPMVMGCVDYHSTGSPKRHQTRFLYWLYKNGPNHGVCGIEPGIKIPLDSFSFEKYPYGGAEAD